MDHTRETRPRRTGALYRSPYTPGMHSPGNVPASSFCCASNPGAPLPLRLDRWRSGARTSESASLLSTSILLPLPDLREPYRIQNMTFPPGEQSALPEVRGLAAHFGSALQRQSSVDFPEIWPDHTVTFVYLGALQLNEKTGNLGWRPGGDRMKNGVPRYFRNGKASSLTMTYGSPTLAPTSERSSVDG